MGARACTADDLDALLPQAQCTRCGYAACRPYAEAIARGEADIDRCAPGGSALIARLAAQTGRPVRPLHPECGPERPLAVAVIDEARCIGCTLCIAACPVDAIAGAPKRMHVVLPSLCSGCELCVAPCPVDCISMAPVARTWTPSDAMAARERHAACVARRARAERVSERRTAVEAEGARRAAVAAALERARARRQSHEAR